MNCSDGIESNADLIGIGVRISIYLQVLLPIIPQVVVLVLPFISGRRRVLHTGRDDSLAKSGLVSSATILITGFAMVFAAIIQAKTIHLTVYHALLTLNLNWLVCLASTDLVYFFGSIIRNDTHTKPPPEKEPVSAAQIICFLALVAAGFHLSLVSAFGVWLFKDLEKFDRRTPECTPSTILSMFGVDVHVSTKKFIHAWFSIYCIFLPPFINIVFLYYFLWVLQFLGLEIWWAMGRQLSKPFWKTRSEWKKSSRPNTMITFTAAKVLSIISTELTIRHNNVQPGEKDWTFGQTLALFLTLPAVWQAMMNTLAALQPKKIMHWPPTLHPPGTVEQMTSVVASTLKVEI